MANKKTTEVKGILIDAFGDEDVELMESEVADHSLFHDYDDPVDPEESTELQLSEEGGQVVRENDFEEFGEYLFMGPRLQPSIATARMAQKITRMSGHQTGYKDSPRKDFVDDRRQEEKIVRAKKWKRQNARFEAAGGRWRDSWKDRSPSPKPVTSELRILAESIGAYPTLMMYPRHMRELSTGELMTILAEIRAVITNNPRWAKRSTELWNMEVLLRTPRYASPMRSGDHINVYVGNAWPNSFGGISGPHTIKEPYEQGLFASEVFMEAAENGVSINNVVTACNVTGVSLVRRKTYGFKSWQIAPNIQGMSIKTARVVVDAAAIIAKLVPGKIRNAPELSYQLAKDGDAWATLAVITNNPRWAKLGQFLLRMRDSLYFQLDDDEVDNNQRELQRIVKRLRSFYR